MTRQLMKTDIINKKILQVWVIKKHRKLFQDRRLNPSSLIFFNFARRGEERVLIEDRYKHLDVKRGGHFQNSEVWTSTVKSSVPPTPDSLDNLSWILRHPSPQPRTPSGRQEM